ncbi:MAG: (2Fe-2S)-binding protein [bacterium]|nr:(2Fe-2S)-binding protein [bacterium]
MDDLRIGNINRKEKVKLLVNGKEVTAYKGETLLAALMASGYKSLKKSPVNGEPRGALCGMGVCFECIVTVNGIPNTRSCMTEVENNMEITIDV